MNRIASVVGRENRICELAIRRLQRKCAVFEEKYGLTSDDFYNRWQQGKLNHSGHSDSKNERPESRCPG